MSTVAAATPASAAAAPAEGGALSKLSGNFNDFLKLLMTQLQHQDPTSPMDTNAFTSQLVQFSSVEQQINTNTSLNKLIEATQGGSVLQASGMVGKTVQATSDHLALQGGKAGVGFALSGAAAGHSQRRERGRHGAADRGRRRHVRCEHLGVGREGLVRTQAA